MKLAPQLAKHFQEVFFGGNWTSVNLKDTLADVDWQLATTEVAGLNTIAALVYHIGYFVSAVQQVLNGQPLTAKDMYSFDCPPIQSSADWDNLLRTTWDDAERLAAALELLPEQTIGEVFVEEKYGSYYRNVHGIIEHTHYHLGQIVVLKKLLAASTAAG